ncbi:MAG: hypothetical protein AAF809_01565 [Bacteroidota bacterium]
MKGEVEATGWTAHRFGLLSALVFSLAAALFAIPVGFMSTSISTDLDSPLEWSFKPVMVFLAFAFLPSTCLWGYLAGRQLASEEATKETLAHFAAIGALVAVASAIAFSCGLNIVLAIIESASFAEYLSWTLNASILGLASGIVAFPLGSIAGLALWLMRHRTPISASGD